MNKASFILEIYSEELPVEAQNKDEYRYFFLEILKKYDIEFDDVYVYTTCCRVVFHVPLMHDIIRETYTEIKGPRIDYEVAVEKFCEKYNIGLNDLIERDKFYFYIQRHEAQSTVNVLKTVLPNELKNFTFTKSMQWNESEVYWVRPIRSIFCLYNNNKIEFEFAGVTSGNYVILNKYLSDGAYIHSFEDYKNILESNFVIFDDVKRIGIIKDQINMILKEIHFAQWDIDTFATLLSKYTECPFIGYNKIDFNLFPITNLLWIKLFDQVVRDENFLNCHSYFIFLSNVPITEQIKLDYTNLLYARLKDALFLFNEDSKLNYKDLYDGLKKILFHERIGSIYDQSQRMINIARYLIETHKVDLDLDAVKYYKIGMLSNLYKDYPFLLPYLSYNLLNGNNYKKYLLSDEMEFIENLDSLIMLFIAGERVTGTKDNFAMRKKAFKVLDYAKTANINIGQVVEFCLNAVNSNLFEEIINFLHIRIKYSISNVMENIFSVMKNISAFDNINQFLTQYNQLDNLYHNHKDLLNILHRLENLYVDMSGEIDEKLLSNSYEMALYYNLNIPFLQKAEMIMNMLDNCRIKVEEENVYRNRQLIINRCYKSVLNELKIRSCIF